MEHDPTTGEILDLCTSPHVDKLFGALAKAQGKIQSASRDGKGNFGKYATLDAVWSACRDALSENGIAVIQIPYNDGQDIALTTTLGHGSGQWIKGTLKVKPAQFTAQGVGSVITYLRRFSLAAMAGVAPGDDDDGEAAVGRGKDNGDKTEIAAPNTSTNGRTRKPIPPADPDVQKAREKWTALRNLIKTEKDADELARIYDGHFEERMFIEKFGGKEAAAQIDQLYKERSEFLNGGLVA